MRPATYLVFGDLHGRVLPAFKLAQAWSREHGVALAGLLQVGDLGDFPDPNATSPRRDQTTIAPQALFLMNHPFAIDAARAILSRPEVAEVRDSDGKVERLYRLIYGRAATADEVALARQFLAGSTAGTDPWRALAQALLMANEFVFVD